MIRLIVALPGLLWATIVKWIDDKVSQIAAALAFYAVLSLAPLILFSVVVIGRIYSGIDVQEGLVEQAELAIGSDGGLVVQTILANASNPGSGQIATIISTVVLMFSASRIFSQLQSALDTIWRVTYQEKRAVLWWLWRRLKAVGMVVVIGAIFLALLVLSVIQSTFKLFVSDLAPALAEITPYSAGQWRTLISQVFPWSDLALSFVLLTLVFSWIFKAIPHKNGIGWRDVFGGAILAAGLIILGRSLLTWYLANGSLGAAYGTAGSLLIVLVWFYYSGQIMLLGAEFTYVYAHRFGSYRPSEPSLAD